MNNLGDYHDLYVQSDTLLLVNVFENFINNCIEIYKLDPAYFLSAPTLAWQTCFKKTEVKSELLTDINMLLIIEKGIRGEITHAIHRYAEANIKYMKNYDKNKESSYVMYLDANNLYRWAMSQRLPVNNFNWKTNMPMFNKEFIKNYDENSDEILINDERRVVQLFMYIFFFIICFIEWMIRRRLKVTNK